MLVPTTTSVHGVLTLPSVSSREATPLLGPEGMSPTEELQHLRRQMSKINRRLLSVELDNVQRQQREKIVYCVGLAYFFMKALLWMNRN